MGGAPAACSVSGANTSVTVRPPVPSAHRTVRRALAPSITAHGGTRGELVSGERGALQADPADSELVEPGAAGPAALGEAGARVEMVGPRVVEPAPTGAEHALEEERRASGRDKPTRRPEPRQPLNGAGADGADQIGPVRSRCHGTPQEFTPKIVKNPNAAHRGVECVSLTARGLTTGEISTSREVSAPGSARAVPRSPSRRGSTTRRAGTEKTRHGVDLGEHAR